MSRLPLISTILLAAVALGGGLRFWAGPLARPATPAAAPRIAAAALRQDVRALRRALEDAHPGLYWHVPKPALDSIFTQTERGLTAPLSRRAFFVRLLPVVAAVRCSHTSLAPAADPDGFNATAYRYLPVSVAVQGGRVYVKKCYVPHPTQLVGAELTSLNHQPTPAVLARLLPLMPADGFNTTSKHYALSNGAFVEGYSLVHPLAGQVALEARPVAGPPLRLTLPTLNLANWSKYRSSAGQTREDFSLTVDGPSRVAVLTLRTFEPKAGAGALRSFLQRGFRQMRQRGTSALIVDVRGNPGGNNALVTDLLAYLATEPFLHIRRAEIKATALPYFSPPRQFAGLDTLRTPATAGYYDVRFRYPGSTPRQPVGDVGFRGRVLVLVDGGTSSAAAEFAALTQAQGRGTLLGEEAGGGYVGATGGQYLHLTLPASQLRVRIPTIRIWLAVGTAAAGHGALPDVPLQPAPVAGSHGRDVPLARALAMARGLAQRPAR